MVWWTCKELHCIHPGLNISQFQVQTRSCGTCRNNYDPWRPYLSIHRTQRIYCQLLGARDHRKPPELLCLCLDGWAPSPIKGEASMDQTYFGTSQSLVLNLTLNTLWDDKGYDYEEYKWMEMQESTKMDQDFLCLCLTDFIWPTGGGIELYEKKRKSSAFVQAFCFISWLLMTKGTWDENVPLNCLLTPPREYTKNTEWIFIRLGWRMRVFLW